MEDRPRFPKTKQNYYVPDDEYYPPADPYVPPSPFIAHESLISKILMLHSKYDSSQGDELLQEEQQSVKTEEKVARSTKGKKKAASNVPSLVLQSVHYVATNLIRIPEAKGLPIQMKARIFYHLVKKDMLTVGDKRIAILLDEAQHTLDFSGCCKIITNDILKSVKQCKQLTTLKLGGCDKITEEGLDAICQSCVSLTNLDISYTIIGETPGSLSCLTNLKILNSALIKLQECC